MTDTIIHQTGRSMIEMLGVLAIIGVLSVGGIAGYSKAMFKHRINKTAEQITAISTNIQILFGNQKNYNGLSLANGDLNKEMLIKAKIIPQEAISGNDFVNPFGGPLDIRDGENHFAIAMLNLPEDACIALATYDWHGLSNIQGFAAGYGEGINCSYDNVFNAQNSESYGGAAYCYGGYRAAMPVDVAVQACNCKGRKNCLISMDFAPSANHSVSWFGWFGK
ncbi:MAG: hypothetical protein ILA52_02370 [Alphaproteobacteria bacterium]|nr:hypothetical protein [Alphaproteobacteria bacterium]